MKASCEEKTKADKCAADERNPYVEELDELCLSFWNALQYTDSHGNLDEKDKCKTEKTDERDAPG